VKRADLADASQAEGDKRGWKTDAAWPQNRAGRRHETRLTVYAGRDV